ncbi:MAG: efflux RND transporter permease subunit [Pseudomonadota bacterium]|uniref:efflux RND transporter permease subunit n=1 Tax=unclassified Ectothiorhodospira TaxID=2684909 RepID=UPI001EE91241|nr:MULTISPECIES: efflux RND transporter permease subunit [unclassified Ectothiorhodospira]MCG5516079.1 efflux RND transporter permease subunit [Ectothiorhodospira sp. 9100]MCG5519111.1 efflux RND transporter permease subunit [Ectothiorhodospira sp. 9905]
MNPARFTVPRPIFTSMVTAIVVTLGLMSLFRLPIDLLPDITFPTISVMTSYNNAGPEEMEQLITRPVEEAVSAVPGVEEVTSTSSEGSSTVRIAFGWGTNLDEATNEVRDRLDRIVNSLPEDADRPRVRRFDSSDVPIMLIGVAAELDPIELRQLIDDRIRPRLERVPGVAAVDVWGGLEREIRVEVDPDRLQSLSLGLEDIRQALRDANITVPAGEIVRGRMDLRLQTPGEFENLDQILGTVVATRDDAPIYLHQVAQVRDTHQRITRLIRINDVPGVRLAIQKQADANSVQVAEVVRDEIDRLNREFPQIHVAAAIDSSRFIERSIANVGRSILYGGSLAVLVLLFFLRHLRFTLVAATAIPVSVIATFGLIHFGGFTLNLMTLGGLALGVGLMVDNAIVVIENIARRRTEDGLPAAAAATEGTSDVAAAVTASTLTTLAIFLPMFFAQEMAGVLFKQLAYVVAFALFCSLLVALTLVPMLMGRKGTVSERPGNGLTQRASRGAGSIVQGIESTYLRLLDAALGHRWTVIILAMGLFILALALVPRLGTEFMPATDEGELRVSIEMEPGTRLDILDQVVRRIEETLVAQVPEVNNLVTSVGGSSFRSTSPSTASLRISLVSQSERNRSTDEIAMELRRHLDDIPGATIRVRPSRGMMMRGMGRGGDEDILSLEVRGFELETIDQVADELERRLEGIEGITDVRLAREDGREQQLVRINRARAADLGVSVSQVARTLETALSGGSAGQYRDRGTETRIWVQMQDAHQMSIDEVLNITVPSRTGDPVSLRHLVELESGIAPLQIERKEQQRVNTVNANIAGRDLGSIVADVRTELENLPLPRNVDITFGGDVEEQQRAFKELGLALLMAVALVYMVMASLYESLRDPLIVMFSVPLALIGVVAMLLITGTTLNAQSLIGIIMLTGISVNNAILLVDQSARLHRSEGMIPRSAVREAARRRLRPILMTSLTTILALIPLAIGIGEGGETQAPMARAVIGGLFSSTLITLLLMPVLYTLFHREEAGSPAPNPIRST